MNFGKTPAFRRLTLGIGSQGVGLVLSTLANLLSVPVLLHAWGAEDYGRWVVASAAAALLGLLDCGLQGYFNSRIRHFWSRGDMADAHRSFRTGLTLHAGPVGAATAIAAALAASGLLPASFPWLAAATILAIPRGLVSGILSAGGRLGLETGLFHAGIIGTSVVVMVAAGVMGLGADQAAATHAGASLLLGWGPLVVAVRRLHPDLDWRPARPGLRDLPKLGRHAPLFFLPRGSSLFLLNVPVLLLDRLGHPDTVVLFSMLRTFTGLARQVVQQCAIPFGIELARQRSRDDLGQVRAVFRLSTWLLAAAAGLAGGGEMVLGADFFRLWSAGQVAFAPWPAGFLLAAIILAAPVAGALSLLAHWQDPLPQAAGILLQTIGGLVSCWLLIPAFGVAGAAFGLAAAEVAAAGLLLWPAAARLMEMRSGAARHLLALPAAALGFAIWGGLSAAVGLWLVPAHDTAEMALAVGIWLALQLPVAWAGWRLAA